MVIPYASTSLLLANVKDKIANNENLIIYDDKGLSDDLEESLIHHHYFYYNLSNFKINLLEEMKSDKDHLKVLDTFLFFHFFKHDLSPNQIMIYHEMLNKIIQKEKIETFEELYCFFVHYDYSLDSHYNPGMHFLENLFLSAFPNRNTLHQISIKKLSLTDLEQEKTCVIIDNNFDDKILKFLFYYLSDYFSRDKEVNLNFVISSRHEKIKEEICCKSAMKKFDILIG